VEAGRLIEEEPSLFYFPKNVNIVSEQDYEEILGIKKK
jgi:hypothetical protein